LRLIVIALKTLVAAIDAREAPACAAVALELKLAHSANGLIKARFAVLLPRISHVTTS
jgi:hypothetical protein